MDSAALLRRVRTAAGLTLRELARRAGTSHSALVAYEQGRADPGTVTLQRVLRAAGHELSVGVTRAPADSGERGDELWQVLELAAMFPARVESRLGYPPFAL